MTARPDLTTEELIGMCERWSPTSAPTSEHLLATSVLLREVAQRLRSERPAVTPEMVEAAMESMRKNAGGFQVQVVREAIRAALSVSSTEGKP